MESSGDQAMEEDEDFKADIKEMIDGILGMIQITDKGRRVEKEVLSTIEEETGKLKSPSPEFQKI